MGDLPFPIYFDFETTSGKKIYNFEEDCSLYLVSYSFVVAFHPCLNLEKIFLVGSFNHSFEFLVDVGYLSEEMLLYFDPITARQLKDCAIAVFNKKERFPPQQNIFMWIEICNWLVEKNGLQTDFLRDLENLTISLSKSSKMKIQLIGPKQTVSFVAFVYQQICHIFQMKSWKPF